MVQNLVVLGNALGSEPVALYELHDVLVDLVGPKASALFLRSASGDSWDVIGSRGFDRTSLLGLTGTSVQEIQQLSAAYGTSFQIRDSRVAPWFSVLDAERFSTVYFLPVRNQGNLIACWVAADSPYLFEDSNETEAVVRCAADLVRKACLVHAAQLHADRHVESLDLTGALDAATYAGLRERWLDKLSIAIHVETLAKSLQVLHPHANSENALQVFSERLAVVLQDFLCGIIRSDDYWFYVTTVPDHPTLSAVLSSAAQELSQGSMSMVDVLSGLQIVAVREILE